MRTIETTATITKDGQLTLQVPPDLSPGQHRVVVVIDEQLELSLPQAQTDPLIGLFSGTPELGTQSEAILQSEITANTGWTWKQLPL
ncbi:MAG: hypothetical protein KME27_25515 [Lyngbya sp. HA4199-MV5]|jgi:hypothetical protein|nr:hypothetical protein [Lyngbya sp. HA4199-MV5]